MNNLNTKNFMTFYDDYRSNNDDDVKVINAAELFRNNQKRERKRWKTYDKILKQCMREIQKANNKDMFFCFFGVPEMIFGVPVYNLKKCIYYICNVLIKNGYHVRFTKPNIIYISWFLPTSNLLPPPTTSKQTFRKKPEPNNIRHFPVNSNYIKPSAPTPQVFGMNKINQAINRPIGRDNDSTVGLGENSFIINRNKKLTMKKPKFDFM